MTRDDTPAPPSWHESMYDALHGLAVRALAREPVGHSLQPTMIVNDAYLRLLKQRNIDAKDRPRVLAAGANMIREVLVDYARRRRAQKRGGDAGRGLPLNISVAETSRPLDVVELNDVLATLAKSKPRAARVVELKYFGGMTGEEVATHLGVALKTVKNDWRFAKAWLYRQLSTP